MNDSLLSRPRNPDLVTTELRVENVPKALIDMLDACSAAHGGKRGPLVIRLLEEFAAREARKWIVIQRVLGGNSTIEELAGMDGRGDDE